jgi:hypothetical protein
MSMTLQCIDYRLLFLKALVLLTWHVKQSCCQQDSVTPIVPNVPLQNEFLIITGQSKRCVCALLVAVMYSSVQANDRRVLFLAPAGIYPAI